MFAPDTDKDTYSNYKSARNSHSKGALAMKALLSEQLRGSCAPTPECLINLPSNMGYTDDRLTANAHAGKLFEDVIDLIRELKAKADR